MKDIGIIEIDKSGFIHRWYGGNRKYLADFLPPSPGWIPEIFLSYVMNYEEGAIYPPSSFFHIDGNRTNNDPINIGIINEDKYKIVYNGSYEIEHVYVGYMQDRILPVTKIKRCLGCGLPIFSESIQSDYDISLCNNCYYTQYDPEDDELTLETNLVSIDGNDILDNIYIDHSRGYTIKQLQCKYKNFNIDIASIIPHDNELKLKPYIR